MSQPNVLLLHAEPKAQAEHGFDLQSAANS